MIYVATLEKVKFWALYMCVAQIPDFSTQEVCWTNFSPSGREMERTKWKDSVQTMGINEQRQSSK